MKTLDADKLLTALREYGGNEPGYHEGSVVIARLADMVEASLVEADTEPPAENSNSRKEYTFDPFKGCQEVWSVDEVFVSDGVKTYKPVAWFLTSAEAWKYGQEKFQRFSIGQVK